MSHFVKQMILWKCVYPTSNLFSEFRFLLIGFSNIMCLFITFGFASWFYTLIKTSSGTNSSCLSSEDAWVCPSQGCRGEEFRKFKISVGSFEGA